jgi:hypothetical protein
VSRICAAQSGARSSAEWGGSAADWNHLRRALSAFLTVHLDERASSLPSRVTLKKIDLRGEKARVPDLPVETFWAIVNATPEHARPCYVTLAATGMRLGEYLGCTERHLVPAKHAIDVPGTKTDESAARIFVDAELWPWIEQGIPSPLGRRMDAHLLAPRLSRARRRGAVGTGRFKTVRVKLADVGRRTTRRRDAAVRARSRSRATRGRRCTISGTCTRSSPTRRARRTRR